MEEFDYRKLKTGSFILSEKNQHLMMVLKIQTYPKYPVFYMDVLRFCPKFETIRYYGEHVDYYSITEKWKIISFQEILKLERFERC